MARGGLFGCELLRNLNNIEAHLQSMNWRATEIPDRLGDIIGSDFKFPQPQTKT
jgi:hypothetical protein